MEGRTTLGKRLIEGRSSLAQQVLDRLSPAAQQQISPLIVRAVVSALGQAIEVASPDPMLAWARMAGGAYPSATIQEVVDVAAQIATESGERLHIDFSSLLVLLEIIKNSVAEVLPSDGSAPVSETPVPSPNGVIDGVLAMLKARDEATCAHSHATGQWCRRIAEEMGLSEATTDLIVQAGILHDIGKIATPDAILFKPTALDAAEWEIMKQHAEFGARILLELPALARFAPIVRAHHERWDGRGYPYGLRGEEIPFEARVVAVADAFHAMISDRPYRRALEQRVAIEILREGRGTQWSPEVVDAMVAVLKSPRKRTASTRAAQR